MSLASSALKVVYDLALQYSLRHMRPPEKQPDRQVSIT